MEAITYKIETFEGPLDLLLSLIQKNKVNIEDIPISLICDQYLSYIRSAEELDMELAGEFLVMASELMLVKSRMLLPKAEAEEEDPRRELADSLLRYQEAKAAAVRMAPLYGQYSGRFVKDTDEITIDKTFVADQDVIELCMAVRRIIAANESRPKAEKQTFAPMIAKPIVPVDVKIVGILHHMKKKEKPTMKELLSDAASVPDLIAIFLGILELIKVRKILIEEPEDADNSIHGVNTVFVINETPDADDHGQRTESDEPIPLSSKAEMHRAVRKILRDRKKQTEKEAEIEDLLDQTLTEEEDELLDDLGLDMQEIIATMADCADKQEPHS